MITVAICGKGGAGKTTTAALLVRAASEQSSFGRLLAVDADPVGGLGLALGMPPDATLNDLRLEVQQRLGAAPAELAAEADYRLLELLQERGPVALLAVGRSEEAGCFCKLNAFLRDALEALAARFDLCLVDAEVGVEQVNRRVMRSVTHLLAVSDTSRKSLAVARAVHDVAGDAADKAKIGLVLNRLRPGDDAEALARHAGLPLVGALPEDDQVRSFDAEARPFFEMDHGPALEAARRLLRDPFWDRPAEHGENR